MIRRLAIFFFCAAIYGSTTLAAQPRPSEPIPPRPANADPAIPPGQGQIVVADIDARSTRDQLRQLLQRYPPELGRILRMDPTLLQSQTYLSQYPAVAQFLAAHPEVGHNPAYYLSFVENYSDYTEPRSPQAEAIRMWRDMYEALGAFVIFLTVAALLMWVVRTFIDYRRWLRVSRVQTEVHNKLMERFSGSGELLGYVQSPAGRKFLESAPIPLDTAPRSVGAPFGRILWSVQVGVVLLAGGLGFQFASRRVIEEVAQGLWMLGILGMALGLGFIVSGFISYVLARRLGLLDPMPIPPPPERTDPRAI